MLLFWVNYSCTSQNSPEKKLVKKDLKQELSALKAYEKQLKKDQAMSTEKAVEYADKCLAVAHNYPKSTEAPQLMNKAHIILSSVGLYQRSVLLADSIIIMYPMYEKRSMVLESLASSYDVFIIPRDKEKVKKYYEMLLTESKNMDTEKRQSIENRLKHINLTFEEYISTQKNN
jgi:hypothetical protein